MRYNLNNCISSEILATSMKSERKKVQIIISHKTLSVPSSLQRRKSAEKNAGIKTSCYPKKIHKLKHSWKNSHFSFCHRVVKGLLITSCFTTGLKSSGTALSVSPSYSTAFRSQTSPTLKHAINLIKHCLTPGLGAT